MFIIDNKLPYYYNVAENKIYGVEVTSLGYIVDNTLSRTAPSKIDCLYTINELRCKLGIKTEQVIDVKSGKLINISNKTFKSTFKKKEPTTKTEQV